MVFEFRMASILSGLQGHLAPAQRPDCCWTLLRMIVFRKSKVRIQRKIMRKRAQTVARVNL